ncbi:unnamed protein product [Gordionus sp. m RMFG-2023]
MFLKNNYQTFNRGIYTKISAKPAKSLNIKPYLLLTVPITAFGLGCWQIRRRKWKLGLIQDLNKRVKREPIEFEKIISETYKYPEYTHVKCEGKFISDKLLYLGPRIYKDPKKIYQQDYSGSLLSSSSKVGYHLIQAFSLKNNANTSILVDRGWIPSEYMNKIQFENSTTDNYITITGLLRNPEVSSEKNKNKLPTLFHKRDTYMAKLLNAQPIFVDLDFDGVSQTNASSNPNPIGGQTLVTLRNEHLSYVITWFDKFYNYI